MTVDAGTLRRVARFAVQFAVVLFLVTIGREWLEAQFGVEIIRTVTGLIFIVVGVVFLILLIPLLVAGMREILAEPATGPVRLPSIRRRSRRP